jgi:hypothetical protein
MHSGPRATELAAAVRAPAFTVGRHIVMREEFSDPASPEGHALLSHELVHTVQQAPFGDADLVRARVIDATHSSEREARAGIVAPTPLAAPAIQRGPDIVKSGQQLTINLTDPKWRQSLEFTGGQTQVVYILKDTTTGEFLKVGKTSVDSVASRFGEYVAAGNKWSRKLAADVWTFRGRSTKNVEVFEAEMRAGLERAGAKLPWDNSRVPGKGPRLGRPGQGIPDTKPLTETQFIDEVEQLRVKHAPAKVPPRRGMSSKQKAKLKAAEDKAAAEAAAAAEKAEKAAQQATAPAGTQGEAPKVKPPTVEEAPAVKPSTSDVKPPAPEVTTPAPKVETPSVGGAGTSTPVRTGVAASRLSSAGRMLAREAPGLLLQMMLMMMFPPEVHIHNDKYDALESQKIAPALQTALTAQADAFDRMAADDPAQSIWATVTVKSLYTVGATGGGDLEVTLQDLEFIGMKLTREYLLIEGQKFDVGKGATASKTITYSVPIFGPGTHASKETIQQFRKLREGLTNSSDRIRMASILSMYKLAKAEPILINQLIRDLEHMRNDDDSKVRLAVKTLLSKLKPAP